MTDEMRAGARQEDWVRYAFAAKALGGSAMELFHTREPERSFWLHRGLLLNNAEAEAQAEDQLDAELERGIVGRSGGVRGL